MNRIDELPLKIILKQLRRQHTRKSVLMTAFLIPSSETPSMFKKQTAANSLKEVVDKIILLPSGDGQNAVKRILKKHTSGSDACVFVSPWNSDTLISLLYTRLGRRQIGIWFDGRAPLFYRNDALDYILLPGILQQPNTSS